MVMLVSEALFINPAVPHFLKFEERGWIKRLVAYPRLIQAWSMFASDAPLGDETVVVEAVTADRAPRRPLQRRWPAATGTRVRTISRSASTTTPSSSITRCGSRTVTAYHQAFFGVDPGLPQRTHHPNDRIVSFQAICVENDSPPPGQTRPHNLRRRTFLSYPPHR